MELDGNASVVPSSVSAVGIDIAEIESVVPGSVVVSCLCCRATVELAVEPLEPFPEVRFFSVCSIKV